MSKRKVDDWEQISTDCIERLRECRAANEKLAAANEAAENVASHLRNEITAVRRQNAQLRAANERFAQEARDAAMGRERTREPTQLTATNLTFRVGQVVYYVDTDNRYYPERVEAIFDGWIVVSTVEGERWVPPSLDDILTTKPQHILAGDVTVPTTWMA